MNAEPFCLDKQNTEQEVMNTIYLDLNCQIELTLNIVVGVKTFN